MRHYAASVATIADRVVQASLKLVLEPVFEADFHPCSYGFRPNRRAHDAVAEVHYLASRSYEWIVEGDIQHIGPIGLRPGREQDRVPDLVFRWTPVRPEAALVPHRKKLSQRVIGPVPGRSPW